MPNVIILAGPNGSGKSTAAPALLKETLHVDYFINADVIAQGLCAYQPEKAAIQAGKIMLDQIHLLANQKANFAFETTLAGRTFATWLATLKKQGYQFHLAFLWLKNVELALSRVQARVTMGGHSIPEATIRRRYTAGLRNFFNLYCPLADSWQLYDSSIKVTLIAAKSSNGEILVKRPKIWEYLREVYYG